MTHQVSCIIYFIIHLYIKLLIELTCFNRSFVIYLQETKRCVYQAYQVMGSSSPLLGQDYPAILRILEVVPNSYWSRPKRS